MSMTGIAKYMHLSIDLKSEKERYFQLPSRRPSRTVLMSEKKAATFSAACSRRVLGSALMG